MNDRSHPKHDRSCRGAPLRVAFNLEQLLSPSPGGVGRYAARLVSHLAMLGVEVRPVVARHSPQEVRAAWVRVRTCRTTGTNAVGTTPALLVRLLAPGGVASPQSRRPRRCPPRPLPGRPPEKRQAAGCQRARRGALAFPGGVQPARAVVPRYGGRELGGPSCRPDHHRDAGSCRGARALHVPTRGEDPRRAVRRRRTCAADGEYRRARRFPAQSAGSTMLPTSYGWEAWNRGRGSGRSSRRWPGSPRGSAGRPPQPVSCWPVMRGGRTRSWSHRRTERPWGRPCDSLGAVSEAELGPVRPGRGLRLPEPPRGFRPPRVGSDGCRCARRRLRHTRGPRGCRWSGHTRTGRGRRRLGGSARRDARRGRPQWRRASPAGGGRPRTSSPLPVGGYGGGHPRRLRRGGGLKGFRWLMPVGSSSCASWLPGASVL